MAAPDAEMLSVVEPTGRHVGVAERSEVHRQGLWHEVFHCLLVRPASPARVVLQRRSDTAKSYPRLLDLSVTGHLQAGESPIVGGLREVAEELGIDVDPSQLISLGRRLLADDYGEVRNREVMHTYLLADDRPLDAFTLDAQHAGGLVEAPVDGLLDVLADPQRRIGVRERDVAGVVTERTIGRHDLVTPVDGYWTVVLVMASRMVAGQLPLAV